ncbi:MAG: hypothetical protein ACR2QJ_09385 [Geminicoccaceae bacterium]
MDVLLVSFAMIFVSMLILLAAQFLRKGELPTGCTPKGCARCSGDCKTKAALREQARVGEN